MPASGFVEPEPLGVVPGVVESSEGGLLGLAVSPAFASGRFVVGHHAAPDEATWGGTDPGPGDDPLLRIELVGS